jgi:hypothetical protein
VAAPAPAASPAITTLLYELLDAHVDTLRLAGSLPQGSELEAHCAYLRDLQRVGREALARAAGEDPPGFTG